MNNTDYHSIKKSGTTIPLFYLRYEPVLEGSFSFVLGLCLVSLEAARLGTGELGTGELGTGEPGTSLTVAARSYRWDDFGLVACIGNSGGQSLAVRLVGIKTNLGHPFFVTDSSNLEHAGSCAQYGVPSGLLL